MKCSKANKPKWKTSADWNLCLLLESLCIKYFNSALCVSNVFKSSWYDVNVINCTGLLWNCYTIHSNLCRNNIIPQQTFQFHLQYIYVCVVFKQYLFFYVYSSEMNIVCVSSVYTFLTICYFVQNICSDVCLINVPSINLHLSGSSLVLILHCIFHHIICCHCLHTLYHLWKMKQNKLNKNVKREMIFNLMNCFCLA